MGLSQAQTSPEFSLASAEGGLEGSVAGWAIGKFGNSSLLATSNIFVAVGYFVFAPAAADGAGWHKRLK